MAWVRLLSALGLTLVLLLASGVLLLIMGKGLSAFAPRPVVELVTRVPSADGAVRLRTVLGELQARIPHDTRHTAAGDVETPPAAWLLDTGQGVVLVEADSVLRATEPLTAVRVDLRDDGRRFGYYLGLSGVTSVRDWSALLAMREALAGREPMPELLLRDAAGVQHALPMDQIAALSRPNALDATAYVGTAARRLGAFLAGGEAAAGVVGPDGLWPAIYGTALLVFVMTLLVTPLGVLAAIYMQEIAAPGRLVRAMRVAVNNLAGVPSIVYGAFGLGLFIHGFGAGIDQLLYAERLPTPTFGTGGLFWAALTMALLTLPVVIVSTEEGLKRVPDSQRHAALALGATRASMIWQVVLPLALPGVLTGMMLAVARAAGEVAPLMLLGVVKYAPSLPLDGDFPYLHLERKFMHLGYQLYDLAFQSRDVVVAAPHIFATAMLLLLLVVSLNIGAMLLRHRLQERYRLLRS